MRKTQLFILGAFLFLAALVTIAAGAEESSPNLPLDGKIDPKNFPRSCEQVKKHYNKSHFPKEVSEALLELPDTLKLAPGKKWLLQLAGVKILIPVGEYKINPIEIAPNLHEATTFLKGHYGISMLIKVRPPTMPDSDTTAKKYISIFGKPMTPIDFLWEAYSFRPDELECTKFSAEAVKRAISLTVKDADLAALSINLTRLKVFKIEEGSSKGILRMAAGTKPDGHAGFRLVLETQNNQSQVTVLAIVANEKQFNAEAANLLGLGDENSKNTRPDWIVKLPTELEAGVTGSGAKTVPVR